MFELSDTNSTCELVEAAPHVPLSIKNEKCWICYCLEEHEDKMAKVPKNPGSPLSIYNCDPTDLDVGVTFEEAMNAVKVSQQRLGDDGLNGVGLQLGAVPIVGIDLDNVVRDGEIVKWAWELIDNFGSFAEISPSGTGVHVLVEGSLDSELGNRSNERGLEMYDKKRFFTFTGRHIEGTPKTIEEAPNGLISAYQSKYMSSDHKAESKRSYGDAEWAGINTDGFPGVLEYDDLTDREQRVVDAGCKYDDDFAMLYEDAESAWEHDDKWVDDEGNGGDKSRCDASLVSKLHFWGREADMFNFKLDFEEIERCFMSAAIAEREKSRTRPSYVRYTIQSKIQGDFENLS